MKCRNIANGQIVWFGKTNGWRKIAWQDRVGLLNYAEFTSEEFLYKTAVKLDRGKTYEFVVQLSKIGGVIPFVPTIEVTGSGQVNNTVTVEGESTLDEQILQVHLPDTNQFSFENIRTITFLFAPISSPNKITEDGYRIYSASGDESYPNYVEDSEAVVASLTQRLSVIKGELWYQTNYGLPLTDKVRSTTIYDMVISDIISSHPGVKQIVSFKSSLSKGIYSYETQILTVFGDLQTISNSTSV